MKEGPYNNSNGLFGGESLDFQSTHTYPFIQETFFSRSREVARELLRPAGRFHSPLGWVDKIKLWIMAMGVPLYFFDFSQHVSLVRNRGLIPYRWQVLLRYLKKEKILAQPSVSPCFFFHDQIKMVSFRAISPHDGVIGRGNALDAETALSKALGELLERVFVSFSFRTISVRASLQEIASKKEGFLSPELLSHFSSEQRKKDRRLVIDQKSVFEWVYGRKLGSKRKILLPVQVIFAGLWKRNSVVIRESNSNGAAGGFNVLEAVLAGIYELVERDAFLIFWLNAIAPPRIDISSVKNIELRKLIKDAEEHCFEVVFLNTTTDITIPSCICVLIDRSDIGPRIALGGKAGFDIEGNLLGSLQEAIMIYGTGDFLNDAPDFLDDYIPFSDSAIDMRYRKELWKSPKMFQKFDFFLQGKRQSLKELISNVEAPVGIDEEMRLVRKKFNALGKGYEIYFYEAESKVLKKIGYHVVKVFIPELIPLYLYEQNAPLGAKRLQEAPKNMGYELTQSLNPLPHPFA